MAMRNVRQTSLVRLRPSSSVSVEHAEIEAGEKFVRARRWRAPAADPRRAGDSARSSVSPEATTPARSGRLRRRSPVAVLPPPDATGRHRCRAPSAEATRCCALPSVARAVVQRAVQHREHHHAIARQAGGARGPAACRGNRRARLPACADAHRAAASRSATRASGDALALDAAAAQRPRAVPTGSAAPSRVLASRSASLRHHSTALRLVGRRALPATPAQAEDRVLIRRLGRQEKDGAPARATWLCNCRASTSPGCGIGACQTMSAVSSHGISAARLRRQDGRRDTCARDRPPRRARPAAGRTPPRRRRR